MESGIDLIAAERNRQIEVEKWTPDHDMTHNPGDLARAASCYAQYAYYSGSAWINNAQPPLGWPWLPEFWKHDSNSPLHNLVRAGALIAAEIDRLLNETMPPL